MGFSSAISALESAMQRVLDEVKHLNPSTHHSASPLPSASVNPVSPLQAHVDPSGRIHLSGGALSPSSTASGSDPVKPAPTRSRSDGFSSWRPLTHSKSQPHKPSVLGQSAHSSTLGLAKGSGSTTTAPTAPVLPLPRSSAPDPPHRFPPPNPTVLTPHLPHSTAIPSQTQKKLARIRQSANTKKPSCYRCGERGHIASSCHSSLVCFACNKVGHRSVTCKNPTLLPSMSPPSSHMESLNSRPSMKFFSNKDTRRLHEILLQGVVLYDQ